MPLIFTITVNGDMSTENNFYSTVVVFLAADLVYEGNHSNPPDRNKSK